MKLPPPMKSFLHQYSFRGKTIISFNSNGGYGPGSTFQTVRELCPQAEIRDDIEWMVNEYTKALKIHKIKASQSLVDVCLITPLEIVENLVKFNWSKIAKGALSLQKRQVELMEAEMKAPGREVAYIYDARKGFGSSK